MWNRGRWWIQERFWMNVGTSTRRQWSARRVSEGEGGCARPNERASRANAYMQMNVLRVARTAQQHNTAQRTGTPRTPVTPARLGPSTHTSTNNTCIPWCTILGGSAHESSRSRHLHASADEKAAVDHKWVTTTHNDVAKVHHAAVVILWRITLIEIQDYKQKPATLQTSAKQALLGRIGCRLLLDSTFRICIIHRIGWRDENWNGSY